MNDPLPAPTSNCPDCAKLLIRIADLEAIVFELRQRLNQNSSNSSIPPSANPLNAPKRPAKPRGVRKQGGQPGHPGHHRRPLPIERIDHVVPYIPENCSHCQAKLPVEKFSLQKAAGGGSILDAHFASGWVNFRCSFPSVMAPSRIPPMIPPNRPMHTLPAAFARCDSFVMTNLQFELTSPLSPIFTPQRTCMRR